MLIYPLESQDPLLGVAVAEEMAALLDAAGALVIGPEVAAGAVPPTVVADGFVSLERLVGPVAVSGAAGADILRGGTGVDVAVTGGLRLQDDGAWLDLYLAHAGGIRTVELQGDAGRLDRLVWLGANVAAALVEEVTGETLELVSGEAGATRQIARLTSERQHPYAGYVTAVAYLAAGLLEDAAIELAEVADAPDAPARAGALRADLDAVLGDAGSAAETSDSTRLARRALLSIASSSRTEEQSLSAFALLREASDLPLADAWSGVIAASVNDRARAEAWLAAAARELHYGRSLHASLLAARGDQTFGAALDEIISDGREAGSAALLGASVVANAAGDAARERSALQELRRSSPFLTYPLERLSYLAFDADEAQLAAEVLSVAVELEPDSDLYWTNLGWALYLLGFLERSEAASLRALELDSNQYIASYNLGLARVVTGRLDAAMEAYRAATRRDPGIDDEAISDLENALVLYPDQPGVRYALAYLYQADGRRTDASTAYSRFVASAADEPALEGFVSDAKAQIEALTAPLPPLEIIGTPGVTLGVRGPAAAPYHPGDPVFAVFELSTPGDSLPARVDLTVTLQPAGGGAPIVSSARELSLPVGAVAFVVDDLELLLPDDLAAGEYLLRFEAFANDEQNTSGELALSVAGERQALRGLLGRGLMMSALESGSPLYGASMLGAPEELYGVLLAELAAAADAAEQALPPVGLGPFAGQSGGEVFRGSQRSDVARFLDYLLASGARQSRFVFVDAYAQWALDGAP